ncbi:amidohydrolase family protein [Chelativorans sp. J32]|uniref:amidohydrolase family protein n=1 Tax=Chelativorans sp. J32 TaxID=935840 RepID=UPI0004894A4B|nr:amidohydrolase family protein [Chelativorans sp. J32]
MSVIDLELHIPASESDPVIEEMTKGRPGTPFPHSLPRPEGYGFANYGRVFRKPASSEQKQEAPYDDGGLARLIADMDRAGVEKGFLIGTPHARLGEISRRYPGRFIMGVLLNPMDGMRAVRELERLVKEEGAGALRVSALYNSLPANDRRYYPLYAKCVELDIPVRIYTAMSYANDRPYDLGHPRYLDDIAVDFPELRIVAGLAGWPWVTDMVALLRRHPNLYVDTAGHHPRYFAQPGSGWEQFLQFGNSLMQDKVMVGLSRYLFKAPFEDLVAEYQKLPLKEAVKEKWLYKNAREFFRV